MSQSMNINTIPEIVKIFNRASAAHDALEQIMNSCEGCTSVSSGYILEKALDVIRYTSDIIDVCVKEEKKGREQNEPVDEH